MIRKNRSFKIVALAALVVVILFFVVPNILNRREERAFSDKWRLEKAKADFHVQKLGDSVEVIPGVFYKYTDFKHWLLGAAYRDLWQQKIRVPVLRLKNIAGGLTPTEFSGGMQTIGIKVRDSTGRLWSVRSVNKDQSAALPKYLRTSVLRPVFRDQTSALNPYGVLVVEKLAPALNLMHIEARLFLFPYDPALGKYNSRMAGRLVMLTRYPQLENTVSILNTSEMFEMVRSGDVRLDSQLYLRNRLFDLLISDWDRHEGNWKWILKRNSAESVIAPIASDRDMAFYSFGEGVLNRLTLVFVEKFQSFTPDYQNIRGLMVQSKPLDTAILGSMRKEDFLRQAYFIQERLNNETISMAFKAYPASAYALVGKEHEEVLKQRLKRLPEAAVEFHQLIQNEQD